MDERRSGAGRNWPDRVVCHGDNLDFLRSMNSETVDLIATDPPFNKGRDFHGSAAGASFRDGWSWDMDVRPEWTGIIGGECPAAMMVIDAGRAAYGGDMGAFLCFMGVRLLEMRRVLKPTGSIYLHCDPTASHYLKELMDAIFGKKNFRNEIIWKRVTSHNDPKRYGAIHDTLLFYVKDIKSSYVWNRIFMPYSQEYIDKYYKYSDQRGRYWTNTLTGPAHGRDIKGESTKPWKGYDPIQHNRVWSTPKTGEYAKYVSSQIKNYGALNSVHERLNILDEYGFIEHPKKKTGLPKLKTYLDGMPGLPLQDIFLDIQALQGLGFNKQEKEKYPTQKPLSLYERIIEASSKEGDMILDPFCGSGTTCAAAEKLGRRWIGMDIWAGAHAAVAGRIGPWAAAHHARAPFARDGMNL